MMRAGVLGIGVLGPGLTGWAAARLVLAGTETWADGPLPVAAPAFLPANERRRTGLPARLALAAAEAAVSMSGLDAASLPCVFASGNGEGAIVNTLLTALAEAAPEISPTLFHNSVHNAVAGYWAIGTGSHAPITCLGGGDVTAGSALLAALAQVAAEGEPVLLCLHDAPLPEPLRAKRPGERALAAALVLGPQPGKGALAAEWQAGAAADAPWRTEFAGTPAAGILPLLAMLAGDGRTSVRLATAGGALRVSHDA